MLTLASSMRTALLPVNFAQAAVADSEQGLGQEAEIIDVPPASFQSFVKTFFARKPC